MRHLIFGGASRFNVAVLVKTSSFNKAGLETSYIAPLALKGIPSEEVIAFTLEYNDVGKAPTAFIKEYLGKRLSKSEQIYRKFHELYKQHGDDPVTISKVLGTTFKAFPWSISEIKSSCEILHQITIECLVQAKKDSCAWGLLFVCFDRGSKYLCLAWICFKICDKEWV